MRVTFLKIDNFKAFDHIEMDAEFFSEAKYLLVGKNGSGKTTVLEALRLCIAQGQEANQQSQYLYGCVRDKARSASLELHLELDDDEVEICTNYLAELNAEGGPAWNHEESDKYDHTISNRVVSKVQISTPMIGGGQNRTGSLSRSQTYMSAPTLELLPDGGHRDQKFHIVHRLFTHDQSHRPLVYLNPFRTVQFQETMLFQNYGATVQNQAMPGMNQAVNDPIRSINYAQPEFGKNYFQFSYAAELYSGILGEFYEIARSNQEIRGRMRQRISREMVHINEMISPKKIEDVEIDLASNALTYQVNGPDGTYTINGLSAGEEQLVIFGLSLPKYLSVGSDEIKPIVIIDEPELHLHPEYCSRLGKFLSDNLPKNNRQQLFIASHSVEIIQELSDCAYQITANSAEKIEDVLDRTQLFHALGAKFSVADIVNKIVFVEGEEGSRVALDHALYQKLSGDPLSRSVRFVEVGNKRNVTRVNLKSKEWVDFIRNQIDANNARDVYAIVDGDVLGWVRGEANEDEKLLVLPCYSVENLLLQPGLIERAYPELTSASVRTAFANVKDALIEHTASQVAEEYKSQSRRSFIVSGSDPKARVESKFAAHLTDYYQEIGKLPSEYKEKIDAEKDWHLFVEGKRLRIEVARELSIKDSRQQMYQKLIEHADLQSMPRELTEWFTANILQ